MHCILIFSKVFDECIDCVLACFLWSKKPKHSSSNHWLCCFNSCSPGLSLFEVLIFSIMFYQALFMSSYTLMFSKATKYFLIYIWYFVLTSSSFSFLRLYISSSNTCADSLFTSYLSLTFLSPDSDQYHIRFPWNLLHSVCQMPPPIC